MKHVPHQSNDNGAVILSLEWLFLKNKMDSNYHVLDKIVYYNLVQGFPMEFVNEGHGTHG